MTELLKAKDLEKLAKDETDKDKLEREKHERHLKEVYRSKNSWKNWAHRGQDFHIKSDDGQRVLKCHQSVSGTLYIYDKSNAMHKITETMLNQMEAEINKTTELPRLNSIGPKSSESHQNNRTQSEVKQK